jgi:glycine betaine/choline ABC-type transport system substrate-binding protein
VEYTGTALTALLKQPPLSDPEAVRRRVSEGLRSQGIVALEPLGFENTFAILMRREQAETLGLTRLSQVSSRGGGLQAGFGTEFMSRPDGYPGLVSAYGLKFQRPPLEMDLNLLYQALRTGTIDLTAGNSTDGRIEAYDLVALEDDRRYFPPYEAVPLARAAVLEARPELRTALELLGGTLDAATMRRLNHQIDGERRAPAEVAREWLTSAGLLE